MLLQTNSVGSGQVAPEALEVLLDRGVHLSGGERTHSGDVGARPRRRPVGLMRPGDRRERGRTALSGRGVEVLAPRVLVDVDHRIDPLRAQPAHDLSDPIDVGRIDSPGLRLEQRPGNRQAHHVIAEVAHLHPIERADRHRLDGVVAPRAPTVPVSGGVDRVRGGHWRRGIRVVILEPVEVHPSQQHRTTVVVADLGQAAGGPRALDVKKAEAVDHLVRGRPGMRQPRERNDTREHNARASHATHTFEHEQPQPPHIADPVIPCCSPAAARPSSINSCG